MCPGFEVCRGRKWKRRDELQGLTGSLQPPLASQEFIQAPAPAGLPQSPPAAKPGPHLGVI